MAILASESLQKKIGPLPAWGWGAAVGGGLLAFHFLRGKTSGQPTATNTSEPSDPVTAGTTPGPIGPAGPAGPAGTIGPAGKDAPQAPPRPACPIPGRRPEYNPTTNSWHMMIVPKPVPTPGGFTLDTTKNEIYWDTTNCYWEVRPKTVVSPTPSPVPKVVSDGAAKGPGILSRDLGGGPIIDRNDVGTTYLAPPDLTPKNGGVIPKLNPLPGMPVIASIPDVDGYSTSRNPLGRPYHGAN